MPFPSMSEDDITAINNKINDPENADDVWGNATWRNILGMYGKGGGGENATPFSNTFDKYFAPFLVGAQNAKKSDLIPNSYMYNSPYDNPTESQRKYNYNEKLNRMSAGDPFATMLGHGLGMTALASGGVPGLVGGLAFKHGVPLMWHLLKQRWANKHADKKKAKNVFNRIMNSI